MARSSLQSHFTTTLEKPRLWHPTRLCSAFLLTLLLACADNATQDRAPTPVPISEAHGQALRAASDQSNEPSATELELIVQPFTDFYFLIRAQAADVVAPDPKLAPVVEAWMPVQEHIGTFGGFWQFDLGGLLSHDPTEFGEWFEDQAETVPSRAGGTIPIRGPGQAMAAAMTAAWPSFRDQEWPRRKERIDEVRDRLNEEFMPKHREALRSMLDSLGIEDPHLQVPVHLVLETHPPGATTYRSRSGPIAVMSIEALLLNGAFSDLEETILHETCHALDGASRGETDAFTVLRHMLAEAGVSDRDPKMSEVPHLVMFAQAENTMRRIYDPEHVAYGDTQRGDIAPLYQRSGRPADVVRRHWSDFLDGEITREEALTRIVDGVVKDVADDQRDLE